MGERKDYVQDVARILRLGKLRRCMLRPYKGIGNPRGRGKWESLTAHPGAWAAHLYCIGDETLIRKQCGESGAAIAKMKRFGIHQK